MVSKHWMVIDSPVIDETHQCRILVGKLAGVGSWKTKQQRRTQIRCQLLTTGPSHVPNAIGGTPHKWRHNSINECLMLSCAFQSHRHF